jgi:aminopeptidase N
MKTRFTICTLALVGFLFSMSDGQHQTGSQLPAIEAAAHEKNSLLKTQSFYQSAASPWLDVTYYRLQLNISTVESIMEGRCTVVGTCAGDAIGSLALDLVNRMKVDSTFINGARTTFSQSTSSMSVTLDRVYRAGEMMSIDIYYEGSPLATGFGSFEFDSHNSEPWVYTLSEPSGARDWWPCKDDPSDKADSADVLVTCDSSFKVGSNGSLVSIVNNGDGTSTTHWEERYPIASYLISFALTNYAQFSNWFHYSPTDSMQVLNYVLPEHLGSAIATLPKTVDMLSVYSNLFGLYPFIKEKYGHSEFGRGGAMEHQTMTSTTTFDEDVISHELAHQWFGDKITCRTWGDLWLNEGFAQYCSGLFREKEYGVNSYQTYMNYQMSLAVKADGAIGMPDTSSVRNLFDGPRMYNKGSTVLHMLRHVLGDSVFFRAFKTYANTPALQYSSAGIRDFQNVCENVSGQNLEYFFSEWIYGEGFPEYGYSWSSSSLGNSSQVTIFLEQSVSGGNPEFFTMPVDILLTAPGWDTVVTVFNNSLSQQFKINVSTKPTNVLIDPNGWILKTAISNANVPPGQYSLGQNYPNPFNPRTSITFRLPQRSMITLRVYDVLGREVATIQDEQKVAGLYSVDWDPSNISSGVYFYRLSARPITNTQIGSFVQTKKMLLMK